MESIPKEIRLLFAGGMSGVLTYTVIAPLERVKLLLQIQGMRGSGKYHGVLGTLVTVLKEEGIRALWKGNGANCFRVGPNYALK